MSEGIQGKKGRQQRRAKSTEDSHDALPPGEGRRTGRGAAEEAAARVAAVLTKSLSVGGTRNRTVPPVHGLYPDVRFYTKSLVNSLTTKNLDATLSEIDRIVATGRGSLGLDCEVLFWSHLISTVLDNTAPGGKSTGSPKKARRLAFRRQLDSFCQGSSVNRLATVINSSLVLAAERSNRNLIDIVECLIGGSDSTTSPLERATELSPHQKIALAAAVCLGGLPSEHKTLLLVKELERALSGTKGDTVSYLPSNLFQTVLCVLETQASGDIQHRAGQIAIKLKAMSSFRDAGESSTAAAWGVASRLSPAGSDGGIGVTNILAELGPACTNNASKLRDILREVTNIGATNGGGSSSALDESAMARLIIFFAERGTRKRPKDGGDSSAIESNGISSVLVGALTNDNNLSQGEGGRWDLGVVNQVIAEDYASLDWTIVARSFDFPGLVILDGEHLMAILRLFRNGAKYDLPLAPIVSNWENHSSQVALLENLLFTPPSVYSFQVNDAEAEDAATIISDGTPLTSANPQGWASAVVLQRLLYLSDIPEVAERVKVILRGGITYCPDVLLCSLLRLQLDITSGNSTSSFDDSVGKRVKGDIMRSLLPVFFRPQKTNQTLAKNPDATLCRLWVISRETVVAFCIEAWKDTREEPLTVRLATVNHVINIIQRLPSPDSAAASVLNNNKDLEFGMTVAFVMADRNLHQLREWFSERRNATAVERNVFVLSLIAYLSRTHTAALARNNDGGPPLVSIENIATSLQFLQGLDNAILSQQISNPASQGAENSSSSLTIGDSVKRLIDACVSVHPSLNNVIKQTSGNADDIEEMANSYFQKIYTSEQSIIEVVEMLKRFKISGNARENDIFACMIHNLFDEYRFFSKYPEKELRITGILFGMLIQHQLVSSITLGIALRYVLEALRKPPTPSVSTPNSNSGKMFRFGMFALEQFKGRLHEWPQYCSHIVQIPHLREKYSLLVNEIEGTMAESRRGDVSASSGGGAGSRGCSVERSGAAGAVSGSSGVVSDEGGNDAQRRNVSDQSTQGSDINGLSKQQPGISLGTVGAAGNQKTLQNPGFVTSQSSGPSTIVLTPSVLSLNLKQQQQFQQQPPLREAVFGPGLGRAVNRQEDSAESSYETPPDAILDRIQFIINNLCASNVELKSQEIKDMLAPKYFCWLGQFLVVKRISTQPNLHSVYLNFLDQLGDFGKGLVEAILSSVYLNVGKLLRSPKITTSTSERSLLKNLGSWLGQITLARNRPILQVMLDCKELLFQGYETGMLIAVTPFVAKILEGAKKSIVFRPPNPWLMGLLSVFRALYGVDDLKMNIKFEVEVLCKNLGVKLEEIPLRTDDLEKRIFPIKERNPDFNMKSSMMGQPSGASASSNGQSAPSSISNAAGATTGTGVTVAPLPSVIASPDGKQGSAGVGPVAGAGLPMPATPSNDGTRTASSASQEQQQTVIPNLAAYVTINPSITQLFQQLHGSPFSTEKTATALKRAVPIAVDRAIREIIQPVVERSVTIACITTKEIVTKDFAMESDENKMRKAAQLMVANLAGSLALVTCREPLRASVSTHLRQLLVSSVSSASGPGSNASSNSSLSDQDQNAVDQCVAICATDNLELGCMLIEKAATEKAVRDMDEALAPALNTRKKHREQTGQPFYDMSVFGNGSQRYPGALPDPLRPKPGGLRPEQLLVYEAFQRMPRQPVVPASQQQASTNSVGTNSVAGDTTSRPGTLPSQSTGGTNTVVKGDGGGQRVDIEALSSIAGKLDSSVTSLLSASGPRAPEITLAMLPNDHEVRQLLLAVQRVMPTTSSNPGMITLSTTETDAILGFAQGIFKSLYELSLSEPLRLETMVALLETLNETCSQLGKDLGTWATYAPTKTDAQRKLHRTVLLLLVRSHLIPTSELDAFLARSMDGGQSPIWVEFTLLFVQTAVVERIAAPSELPKVMDVLTKIGDGRVQGHQQVNQAYRKPIMRLLEELNKPSVSIEQRNRDLSINGITAEVSRSHPTHQQSSSISAISLNNLAEATKRAAEATESTMRNDPPTMKQQVTFLLKSWVQIQKEAASNEKALAQYLQLLQQNGVGKVEEQTERFLRLSTDIVIEDCLKSAAVTGETSSAINQNTKGNVLNYNVIDAYAKLASLLVRYMNGGGSPEQVAHQRLTLLNKVLGVTVRTMMANYERSKQEVGSNLVHWDQRPWFRLLLNLVHELNSPSPTLDPISLGILSVFGSAFHVVQPLVIPAFAFAWLELISHRMFLSNLLLIKGQKGWGVAHQLLIDLFLFLEPHLRKTELTDAIKQLYKGTLRVLLVLLHDFPSFLAGYHLSFCNVIPENCVQLRNLILSAFPRGMVLPDPFPRNFKIDLLPEISQSPVVLSNVAGPLGSIRADLDSYLKGRQPPEFVSSLLPRLYKDGVNDVDAPRINSLVLYVGIQGLARLQNSQIAHTLAHTPEMEVLQKLMDFDDRGRYISLNAIANQLRYPSSHTHYFSCVMLFLFEEAKDDAIKEQITRVLLERLIVHRPHPWGLLITFIELIKNQKYQFWSHPFTRCATEIEKVFESVARSCMTPASLRAVTSGGGDDPQ